MLDQSRLRAYLDDAISAQTQFRLLRASYDTAPRQQQKKFDLDFLAVEQQIVAARGRADSYHSFDASLAVPVCLSVEIASKYQNGKTALIPETLRHYLNWLDRIQDVKTTGSLARSLKDDSDSFNSLFAGGRFDSPASLGCVVPRVVVFYWPQPDVNQIIYNYQKALDSRAILANLGSRDAAQSGAKEIYVQTLTIARSPGLSNCEQKKLDSTFGISIEGRGTMVADAAEIETSPKIHSDARLLELAENSKKTYQADLDSLNRRALRIALLADALAATQEARVAVVRTLRQLGEI